MSGKPASHIYKVGNTVSLHELARAAITKYHRLGGLNNIHVRLEAESLRSRCWQGWFLLRALSLDL